MKGNHLDILNQCHLNNGIGVYWFLYQIKLFKKSRLAVNINLNEWLRDCVVGSFLYLGSYLWAQQDKVVNYNWQVRI